MELPQILANCQSPDAAIRTQAEEQLRQAQEQNLPMFIVALVQELANEERGVTERQIAGLYMKNLLDAKDTEMQNRKARTWLALDPNVRAQVKETTLRSLLSRETVARHTAAQLAAKIGVLELPQKQWPELLTTLLSNVTGSADDGVKHASLETLGYLCEELDDDVVDESQTNQILTAIVDGIRKDRPDHIREAAATALRNSLEFAKENMGREQERNMIMTVICEATQSQSIRVRVVAYECISTIASLYYDKLQPYMQVLFDLTFGSIRKDSPEVGLQAIEFWSTICDEEMELIEEAKWAAMENRTPDRQCMNYIKAVLQHLVPLLTETLTGQEEDQEDDTWNLAMAGATCLGLVAQTAGDDIVDLAMQFVTPRVTNPDWRQREAALMCFGSILEGPSEEKLSPLVNSAMTVLLQCMSDAHVMVKDTAAWAIGRICDLHAQSISQEQFRPLLETLVSSLADEPRVASNVCYAIHNLAQAFENVDTGESNILSPYFGPVLEKLLQVTEREDWAESHLRAAAYEAVNMLIQAGAPDTKPFVLQMLPVILERLERTFGIHMANESDKEQVHGQQSLLCGVVQVCAQRLEGEIKPFADRIMTSLLKVFQSVDATAHEEAFMAVGALANAVEGDFQRYMEAFRPFLALGLRNYEEYMVCSVAVGVVGDACRALEGNIAPYCDEIVTLLLQNLQNPQLNQSVKPPVLSCFGDIALAIGGAFEKYLQVVMNMLQQASRIDVPQNDEELIDFINQLREGILEAYTGIIQGLSGSKKANLILPYAASIAEFLQKVAVDPCRDESVTRAGVGVIGDLAHALGAHAAPFVRKDYVNQLLNDCASFESESTQQTCEWARGIISAIPSS